MSGAAPARPVVLFSFFTVLFLIPLGEDLSAQRITGRALDAEDETPVPTAEVVLVDSAGAEVAESIADSLGRFTVTAPEGGTYHLVAERIGYRRAESPPFEVHDTDSRSIDLLMEREPVALEELPVNVEAVRNRLERRRRGFAEVRSSAFDRDDFDHVLPRNLADHVASRSGTSIVSCARRRGPGARACFDYRNAQVPICVYLDEAPLAGGVEAVSGYADYIERVEVYPALGWIRLYSRPFMVRVEKGRETIMPFARGRCVT